MRWPSASSSLSSYTLDWPRDTSVGERANLHFFETRFRDSPIATATCRVCRDAIGALWHILWGCLRRARGWRLRTSPGMKPQVGARECCDMDPPMCSCLFVPARPMLPGPRRSSVHACIFEKTCVAWRLHLVNNCRSHAKLGLHLVDTDRARSNITRYHPKFVRFRARLLIWANTFSNLATLARFRPKFTGNFEPGSAALARVWRALARVGQNSACGNVQSS